MSDRDWGWPGDDGSLQALVDGPPAGKPATGGALIDRLLADLGSDPNYWFAERERLREEMTDKRQEIAALRREQAKHEALYESHGQQPSMFDNLRKIELAKAVSRVLDAGGDKLPEWKADAAARQDREYVEFITRHHGRKEMWLERKQDEADLWTELRELEDEHATAIDKVQMLKSLTYYLGQETRI